MKIHCNILVVFYIRYDYVEIHDGGGNDSSTLVGRLELLIAMASNIINIFTLSCFKGTAAKTSLKTSYHLVITCPSCYTPIPTLHRTVSSLNTRPEPSPNSPHAMRTTPSTAPMAQHVSPLSWSVTDTKNAAMAATNFLQPVETGLARQKGSPAPPTLQNAYPPYKSVTDIEIALTEATSQTKFAERQARDVADRSRFARPG